MSDKPDTRTDMPRIAKVLEGTCMELWQVLGQLDLEHLDQDDVEYLLPDQGIERCAGCDWWHHVGELDDEDVCDQCGGAKP